MKSYLFLWIWVSIKHILTSQVDLASETGLKPVLAAQWLAPRPNKRLQGSTKRLSFAEYSPTYNMLNTDKTYLGIVIVDQRNSNIKLGNCKEVNFANGLS